MIFVRDTDEDDLNVIFKQWPKIQILDGLYYLSHWSSQEFRSRQDSGLFKVQGYKYLIKGG